MRSLSSTVSGPETANSIPPSPSGRHLMALAGQYELDRAIGQACVLWICQGGWLASSQMDRGTPHRRAPLVWAGGDRPGGGFRAPLPKPLPYRLRPQAWLEWGRPYRVGSLARRSGVADRDDALVASRWKGHRGADPTDVGDRWPPPPRACRGWHGGPPPASQPGLTDVRIARDWDVFNLGRVQAVESRPGRPPTRSPGLVPPRAIRPSEPRGHTAMRSEGFLGPQVASAMGARGVTLGEPSDWGVCPASWGMRAQVIRIPHELPAQPHRSAITSSPASIGWSTTGRRYKDPYGPADPGPGAPQSFVRSELGASSRPRVRVQAQAHPRSLPEDLGGPAVAS